MIRTLLATLLVAVFVSCSVVVPEELDPIRCTQEGAVGPPACPGEQRCLYGACTPCGANGCGDSVGGPCSAGGCNEGQFCADPKALGFQGPLFCTKGCCTSEDCGTGNAVCFPTGSGASLCIPGQVVGRNVVGQKPAGTSCAGGAECRSGLCDGNLCSDVCCGAQDCPSNAPECTLRQVPGASRQAFVCGQPYGTSTTGEQCSGGNSCATGACVVSNPNYCTQTCCRTDNCPQGLKCVYDTDDTVGYRVCESTGIPGGPLPIGSPCSQNTECKTAQCVQVGQLAPFCTDACCSDSDCGDTTAFACRPLFDAKGTALLLCVPR